MLGHAQVGSFIFLLGGIGWETCTDIMLQWVWVCTVQPALGSSFHGVGPGQMALDHAVKGVGHDGFSMFLLLPLIYSGSPSFCLPFSFGVKPRWILIWRVGAVRISSPQRLSLGGIPSAYAWKNKN